MYIVHRKCGKLKNKITKMHEYSWNQFITLIICRTNHNLIHTTLKKKKKTEKQKITIFYLYNTQYRFTQITKLIN